jgi:hypothetical protein
MSRARRGEDLDPFVGSTPVVSAPSVGRARLREVVRIPGPDDSAQRRSHQRFDLGGSRAPESTRAGLSRHRRIAFGGCHRVFGVAVTWLPAAPRRVPYGPPRVNGRKTAHTHDAPLRARCRGFGCRCCQRQPPDATRLSACRPGAGLPVRASGLEGRAFHRRAPRGCGGSVARDPHGCAPRVVARRPTRTLRTHWEPWPHRLARLSADPRRLLPGRSLNARLSSGRSCGSSTYPQERVFRSFP